MFLEVLVSVWIKKIELSKWILTEKNLNFFFDKRKFKSFKKNSFNQILGWDLKKNYKNFDIDGKKKIFFKISKNGYRNSRFNNKKNAIATFGDSYVFSRQVSDKHTWQEYLSNDLNIFVSNYGVGNYGLDQAFLKYLNTKISKKTKMVIFGFVPETICRIQSIWKNYLEFGNIHAFKPYVKISKGDVIFNKNYLKNKSKLSDIPSIIEQIKKSDRFYETKYLSRIFKFPYSFCFLKNFILNLKIFISTFVFIFKKKIKSQELNEKIFPHIMSSNIDDSHKLYLEKYSQKLLIGSMFKIQKKMLRDKKKVLFVIFPQLDDLKKKSRRNYQNLYKKYDESLNILDLTDIFLKKDFEKYYLNDKYGGHLNSMGNKFVAQEIKRIIKYERDF